MAADMGKITAGGREMALRGLTRREVRKMREDGIDLGALPMSQADLALDRVLEMVVSAEDLDYLEEQCNSESVRAFRRIMDLTWGREDEAGN